MATVNDIPVFIQSGPATIAIDPAGSSAATTMDGTTFTYTGSVWPTETTLTFTGSSTASGPTYYWEFGDGATDDGAVVTHSYPVAIPSVMVRLIVTDDLDRQTEVRRILLLS